MDETIKAYLAGILDADGYFTIKRSTYHMRVRGDATQAIHSEKVGIKQVQPEAIDLLCEYFGGSRRIEKPSAKHGKMLHAWSVTDKKAVEVVNTLLPYLRIKRRQAELLLDLRESKARQNRIVIGTFSMVNRWGQTVDMPRRIVDPDEIAKRDKLTSEIKKLNDSRPTQPRLIGRG